MCHKNLRDQIADAIAHAHVAAKTTVHPLMEDFRPHAEAVLQVLAESQDESPAENQILDRIGDLEALAADQVDALEKHSRAIAELRTHMNGAQAAIRGLGKQVSPHPNAENDL